ncbi:hypothetical protein GX51_01372 [Blastomyces parvus]|uniref:Zn(2)-C6 fungal-type domain-containing protein n=1 Tax=Blastomyces parvus TaxID=2060905 RepID=A0A2B7XHW6_9EURO|nr:hypothetical protein GX51_01372 [Blastomyces parvus]
MSSQGDDSLRQPCRPLGPKMLRRSATLVEPFKDLPFVQALDYPKLKACSSCIKAKRRCDLRVPQCKRCSARGLNCNYGAMAGEQKQSASDFAFANDEAIFDFSSLDGLVPPDSLGLNETDQSSFTLGPTPQNLGSLQGGSIANSNMSDYNSHTILSLPPPGEMNHQEDTIPIGDKFDAAVIQLYVDELKTWLRQWVSKGTNPFIHHQLYYDYMPSEVQDGYNCCSIYSTKNPQNQRIVYRIIEEKVASLLDTGHIQQQLPRTPNSFPSHLSLTQHLARVQCLLMYQIMRLFDGDIRQQALAEQQAPILKGWLHEMWDSLMNSGLDVYHNDDLTTNPSPPPTSSSSSLSTSSQPQKHQRDPLSLPASQATTIWKEWLIAESVRRTLITARGLAWVYDMMKLGVTVCPGGAYFIASAAVWEAPSAYRWAKAWRERERRHLVSTMTLPSLVGKARASDVDEFGKALLMLMYSGDAVERWIAETGGGEGEFGLELGH